MPSNYQLLKQVYCFYGKSFWIKIWIRAFEIQFNLNKLNNPNYSSGTINSFTISSEYLYIYLKYLLFAFLRFKWFLI